MAKDQKEEDQPKTRKKRSDAGIPRLEERDGLALRWVGEQGAASADNLRYLLGRLSEYELDEPDCLSVSRVRHILEDRWLPAQVVEADSMLGKKWVWPTRRGLTRAGLSFFSPHRPADINLNHIHHCNRIRLHLEQLYGGSSLPGIWESSRMIERSKKEWKARKKEDPGIYIPDEYRTWHMPDAIWTYRNEGHLEDQMAFIEVELSPKGLDRTADILLDLARHATSTWYFIDTNPKRGVLKVLTDALERFTGREEHYRGRFFIYDVMQPDKLVWEYKRQKTG